MHIKSVNTSPRKIIETKPSSQSAGKLTSFDKYEPPFALPSKTAEHVLASSEKAVRKVKALVDKTFYVTESERSIDLAVGVRDLKTQLREFQAKHDEGDQISRYELFELRRSLWDIEVEISQLRAETVAATLLNCSEYALFDLIDARDSPDFATKVLRTLSDNALAVLDALGITERVSPGGALRVTDNGVQTLKDALFVIETCDD